MKRILLCLSASFLFQWMSMAQVNVDLSTVTIETFPNPSTKVSASVVSGELRINFTSQNFWGDDLKIVFANPINMSGVTSPSISYDAAVSATNGLSFAGTGTQCNSASLNFIPLGISVIDSDNDYSSSSVSSGIYDQAFSAFTNAVTLGGANVNYASITGISIKPSSFTTPSGVDCVPSTVSGTIIIRNLVVPGTATSILSAASKVGSFNVFPNPVATGVNATIEASALSSASSLQVMVYDLTGKMVQTSSISSASIKAPINTSSLAKGSYIVKLMIDGEAAKSSLLIVQ